MARANSRRAPAGHPAVCTQPSRDELILRFLPMAQRIAAREFHRERRRGARFLSLGDIEQELTCTLIALIDGYRPERSDSLEAYLAQHLKWRAPRATGRSRTLRDSCDPFIGEGGHEVISAVDLPPSLGTECSARGRRTGVDGTSTTIPLHRPMYEPKPVDVEQRLWAALDPAERQILDLYLRRAGDAEAAASEAADSLAPFETRELDRPIVTKIPSQAEIAGELGIDQSTVSRALKKIQGLVHNLASSV